MTFIPRRIILFKQGSEQHKHSEPLTFEALREVPAWVLLGEPGAGKTEVFKSEAKAVNGKYLSVSRFINIDEFDETWNDKCLFLDGLDECYGNADSPIVYEIISKLEKIRKLNNSSMVQFRIACRAADWLGYIGTEDLIDVSQQNELPVYKMLPFNDDDIYLFIKNNHNRAFSDAEVQNFIVETKKNGIFDFLQNPQMLDLTIKAFSNDNKPKSRYEIFDLACQSLINESNVDHQKLNTQKASVHEDVLGQLMATILLADLSGVALLDSAKDARYPSVNEFGLNVHNSTSISAHNLINNKLFVPSYLNEQWFEPMHRSIAEFMVAKWLGKQINSLKITKKRLFNLILGFDKKPIGGLRGLYGWLANTCVEVEEFLIRNDPLTVFFYSDHHSLGEHSKKLLLQKIRCQFEFNRTDFSNLLFVEDWASFYDVRLLNDYLDTLNDPDRSDLSQIYTTFVLKIIKHSNALQLETLLPSLVLDDSRYEGVRRCALEAWIESFYCASKALDLLNQLNTNGNLKENQALLGMLLERLFPEHISTIEIFNYMHKPDGNFSGDYHYFWIYEFPDLVIASEIPLVLEQFNLVHSARFKEWDVYDRSRILEVLVRRAIEHCGDEVSDLILFGWLRIWNENVNYDYQQQAEESNAFITQWFRERPIRYQGVVDVCIHQGAHDSFYDLFIFNKRYDLACPADMGLWHLNQVDVIQEDILRKKHLGEAYRYLISKPDSSGLTLEMLEKWADNDAVKLSWLEPLLLCELTPYHLKKSVRNAQNEVENKVISKSNGLQFAAKLSNICLGKAEPDIMAKLAMVWLGLSKSSRGKDPYERFMNYCDNHVELFDATKQGMKAFVKRNDLPSVENIIKEYVKQMYHVECSVCLLGMDLIWNEAPNQIDALDDACLQTMICFWLTKVNKPKSEWFDHLVIHKPELVSSVFIQYVQASFNHKLDYIDGLNQLVYNSNYQEIARLTVPALLGSLPARIPEYQIKYFQLLLLAALKYCIPELLPMIDDKLKLKSLNKKQKLCFLFAGMLVDANRYEEKFWAALGADASQKLSQIELVSFFLDDERKTLPLDVQLSPKTIGKLIEVLTPNAEFVDLMVFNFDVTPGICLGFRVKHLIKRLCIFPTDESLLELNRLLSIPSLDKIRNDLLEAKQKLIDKLREKKFKHADFKGVISILADQEPSSTLDLQSLILDRLDQIAHDIKTSNSDIFRHFWTEDKKKNTHKDENSCRDALLGLLRNHLRHLNIQCEPEVDYVNDKRADIRVSFFNQYIIPIEVKGEWHDKLWTAMHDQLPQYTQQRRTDGYAVYLVLWVGGKEQQKPKDGGKKPSSCLELQERLQSYILTKDKQSRTIVRVIDVCTPQPVPKQAK